MTLVELMQGTRSENERKKILIAYYKGWNEGLRTAIDLITESDNNKAEVVDDE